MLKLNTDDKALCHVIGVALIAYAKGLELIPPRNTPLADEPFERVPAKPSIVAAAESMKDALGAGKVVTYSDPSNEVKPVTVTEEKFDTTKAFQGEQAPTHAVVNPDTKKALDAMADLDDRGVAFNEDFCSRATEPFYTSGTRQGQWKKRRGLDQKTYDAWYTGELLKLKPAPAEQPAAKPEAPAAPETTKAAFGGQAPAPTPPSGDSTPDAGEDEPTSAGELMGWVAEMQTAERLDQDGIDRAYTDSGFTPGDLFSGKDGAVKGLYNAMRANLK